MAGRKQLQPTDAQRNTVKTLAGFGIPHESIAKHIGIAPKTLTKHFKDELQQGVIEANQAVVTNLHRLASRSKNPVAAMFWCKTRMGWRERDPNQEANKRITIEIKRGPARRSKTEQAEVVPLDESDAA